MYRDVDHMIRHMQVTCSTTGHCGGKQASSWCTTGGANRTAVHGGFGWLRTSGTNTGNTHIVGLWPKGTLVAPLINKICQIGPLF